MRELSVAEQQYEADLTTVDRAKPVSKSVTNLSWSEPRSPRDAGRTSPAWGETMDGEETKQLVLRLYDALNDGDAAAIGDLVTADYVEHDPLPGQGTGREGFIDRFSMIVNGLAPQFTVHDMVAEDDKVVVRWTNAGTHVGEFAGIPATGHAFDIGGIDIYRLEGGRLCEHWHQIDEVSMLGQLGLLPQPSATDG
jgi:steroid delta-isomerase-like uncharacterized protein